MTAVSSSPLSTNATDSEFLQSLEWKKRAPAPLVQAARAGDVGMFCAELLAQPPWNADFGTRHPALRSRDRLAEPPRTAWLLEIADALEPQASSQRASTNGRRKRKMANFDKVSLDKAGDLLEWCAGISAEEPATPWELLLLLDLLLDAGRRLPADCLFRVWRTAFEAAARRLCIDGLGNASMPSTPDGVVLAGELPWQAGLLFGLLKGFGKVRRQGARVLCSAIFDHTDTDGTPQAELVESLWAWLTPLVRAAVWADRFETQFSDKETQERYGELLHFAATTCDRVGTLAFDRSMSSAAMLALGMRLAGCSPKDPPFRLLVSLEASTNQNGSDVAQPKSSARPGTQSDWARVACLRSDWSPDADTLVVTHHRPQPLIDLSAIGRPLFSGAWELQLSIGGDPVELQSEWDCVCWHSDRDCDYVELQMTFPGSLRIERQLLLSRGDRYALLADSIAGAPDATVEYTSRLPLVEGLSATADMPTRECVVQGGGVTARCLPLALEQDRVLSCPGRFEPSGERLELQQTSRGGLYAPLLIDWKPGRRRSEADWRTLTVGEELHAVGRDVASGHRLRIGKLQLLVYHSLVKSDSPRTVLGQHTFNETIVGKFDEDGELTPILLVE